MTASDEKLIRRGDAIAALTGTIFFSPHAYGSDEGKMWLDGASVGMQAALDALRTIPAVQPSPDVAALVDADDIPELPEAYQPRNIAKALTPCRMGGAEMTRPTDEELDAMVKRARERAKEDRQIQANNEAVAVALKGQRLLFDQGFRSQSNTFAVRLGLDYENCAKRDSRLASDWEDAAAAITALRAQLAEAKAEKEKLGRELNLSRYGQPDFSWQVHKEALAEANARADRADAERAAQIEVDAGLIDALYRMALKDSDADLSSPWKSHKASAYGTALQAIRNQPHDRTALDRMLAEAEARGYQLAADEAKRSGWHLRRYDLVKRDAELATP